MGKTRDLHDGAKDGLVPLESLDLDRISSFSDLLRAMSRTAFGGRALGEAFDVTLAMARDPDCRVVLTLSGAMTIAKMGRIIARMIDAGLVHAVVSTGALITHGISEAIGRVHYRHDPSKSDDELFALGYNRILDTLEMEHNLDAVEEFSARAFKRLGAETDISSETVCRAMGELLAENPDGAGVLRSAYLAGVPVYIPAFTDSELGLDLWIWAMKNARSSSDLLAALPRFNAYLDLQSFARFALSPKRLGIFTVGGGVPRNWAQEIGPCIDAMNNRLGFDFDVPRYHYGVRLCPEPVHWGGLSGCTYSEGVSWGKFTPPSEGGRFAEVFADATTVWPLLIKAVLEELER
ncbi:MAG: deoxyhypusine synthase family protein [Vicinamibacteria bacterium]|nr:deoxyhypusine synthase family protein [Vicinamibacteria bacterium]